MSDQVWEESWQIQSSNFSLLKGEPFLNKTGKLKSLFLSA
jgi:hypothetical protein